MSNDNTVIVKFDERSPNWSQDPEFNKLFITTIFNHARDLLKTRGHLFLNEIFDELGLPRTAQGQLMGWLYSEKETWWEIEWDSEQADHVVLKFYTQGEIYDKIEES